MRRIGLSLAIAALAAGCSFSPNTSTSGSKEPAKVDFAGNQKGFEDANTLFANQRYDQAARLCEGILRDRPYYAPAHLLLARSCHAAGKDDSAIPRYRALLNISPNHVEGLTELAAIYRARGDSEQAVTLLERAYDRAEGREDVATALSACWTEITGSEEGMETCLAHLKTHPSCVAAAGAAARRLMNAGEADRAREVVEAAVQAGARAEDLPDLTGGSTREAEQPNPEPLGEEASAAAQPTESEDVPMATPPSADEAAPPAESPQAQPQAEPPKEEPAPVPPPAEEPKATAEARPIPPPQREEPKPVEKPQPPAPGPEPPKAADVKPSRPTPPAAVKAKEPVVAEKPARLSPEAQQWIEEGDRSLAEGLAADALEAYRKSKAHGGPEAILAVRIERATKSREEAQRAVRDLKTGLTTAQDPSGHRLRLAAAYLQDGRYLEAQLLLLQTSVIAPDCGEAFYLLGVAYEKRSEWRQASDAFGKVMTLCPGTALDVQAGFHQEEIAAHLDH